MGALKHLWKPAVLGIVLTTVSTAHGGEGTQERAPSEKFGTIALGGHGAYTSQNGEVGVGGGLRYLLNSDDKDWLIRVDLEFNSNTPWSRPRATGVTGHSKVNVIDRNKRLFFEATLVDGSPSRTAFMGGRVGMALGDRRTTVSLYGGEQISKEYIPAVMALTLVAGAQLTSQLTDWVKVRTVLEAGPMFATHRQNSGATDDPFGRAPLPDAETVGVGSFVRGDVDLDVVLGEKSPFHLLLRGGAARIQINQRLRPSDTSPEEKPVVPSVNWDIGASASFGVSF